MGNNLFIQISALLTITVSVAFIIRFFKQPLLVSYMIAGVICGPLLFNLLNSERHLYEAFSNFGVVLLLFIVGLELNFSYLKKIGGTSLRAGLYQFFLNFSLIFVVAFYFLDLSLAGTIFITLAACFSSTIVILKLINDKHEEDSVYGRYTVGLMLIQDIISIAILFCLSVFYSSESSGLGLDNIIKILLVIAFIFLSYKFVLPRVIDKIASSGEFLFIFTVAWCFGIASLMVWSGLSIELGAIVAGLTLGTSRYQPEIISRIKPLRDFFIVIFFIILGSMADFRSVDSVLVPALILAGFVILVKPIILFLVFRKMKFTRRNSLFPALTSVPLSEFGFIILLAAIKSGYVSGLELSIFTIATIITIFVSSYMINYSSKIYSLLLPVFNLWGHDKYIQKEDVKESFSAMVFGYHRTGWKIGNSLKEIGLSFAAVDFNPSNVARLTDYNIKTFFGDISDVEFLKALPLDKTKFIISTVHSPEDQLVLLDYLRTKKKKNLTIICTLYNKKYLEKLYEAGADYVMLPHLLSGTWISGLISKGVLSHKRTLQRLRKVQFHELEGSLDHHLIDKIVNFS
jgi:Kef-type K+ transport system membrane component KefB